MTREPEVIVVGTGVAGQTAAHDISLSGKRTAIVDRREFGGTCGLRGCEPKKVLFTGAEAVERVRAQAGHGPSGDVRLDWRALVDFKRTFTDPVTPSIEEWLSATGVELIRGEASFDGPRELVVDGRRYEPESVVLATGAVSRPLGIPGEDLVSDAEAFMAMDEMSGRVVFVGGGYISFEFAHMAAAAGAEVSILHRSERMLAGFDPELVSALAASYRERGIDVRTNAPVVAVERAGEALRVRCGDGFEIDADLVVHGAGRVPDLAALKLDAAGIEAGPHGVVVDEGMRSVSHPHVYAVGDAASRGPQLTPVAIAAAHVAARNVVEPGCAVFEPPVVPSVAFAYPPLAAVGLGEEEARGRAIDIMVKRSDASGWASERRVGSPVAGAVVLSDAGTRRILGAHLLGHHAEEVVNVFAVAIAAGLTTDDLGGAIWAYPTLGSEIVYLV